MKVVVSGYYGFNNAGDEALLNAIVQELKARGHTPVVLSKNPQATLERLPGIEVVKRTNLFALVGALMGAKVLLSGGGTLLQDKTSVRSLQYYLTIVRLAKLLRKKVVVLNQSLGPLSPQGEQAVKNTVANSLVFMRDRVSLAYAQRLGLNAHLGADCALALTPPNKQASNTVVLVPREGTEQANHMLLEVAKTLISKGEKVLILGVQPGYDDADLAIYQNMDVLLEWEPSKVYQILANAKYVVSVRLHGAILAAAAGTPFAGVAYDPKVRGFCEDAGGPCFEEQATPEAVVQCVLNNVQPDWSAITTMKDRLTQSLDQALEVH